MASRSLRASERSEEHTSELQSQSNLVCRLLPAPTGTSPLSLHDALPISGQHEARHGEAEPHPESSAGVHVGDRDQHRRGESEGDALEAEDRGAHAASGGPGWRLGHFGPPRDRKSTRLNSSHSQISYAVFCPHPPVPPLFPYTTLFRSPASTKHATARPSPTPRAVPVSTSAIEISTGVVSPRVTPSRLRIAAHMPRRGDRDGVSVTSGLREIGRAHV